MTVKDVLVVTEVVSLYHELSV